MSSDTHSKTLDPPSTVGSSIRSRRESKALDSVDSSSLSLDLTAESESPRLDEVTIVESVSSDDEVERSLPMGPGSRIGESDINGGGSTISLEGPSSGLRVPLIGFWTSESMKF